MQDNNIKKKKIGRSAIGAVFCVTIMLASMATAIDISSNQPEMNDGIHKLSYEFLFETPSLQLTNINGQEYNTIQDRSQLSVTTTAGYSFSKQVTGGFNGKWIDSSDKKTKRKMHTRELGIWLTLKF